MAERWVNSGSGADCGGWAVRNEAVAGRGQAPAAVERWGPITCKDRPPTRNHIRRGRSTRDNRRTRVVFRRTRSRV